MNPSLFSRPFLILCVQFLLISTVVALFFPLQAYLQKLGFSEGTIGFLIGADALSAFFLQPIVLPLVTAVTAKRWILAGSFVLAAALYLEGSLIHPAGFVAARLMQGCGFIVVVSGIMVLFVEVIPKTMSGRAFGWISLIRLFPYAAMPAVYDALDVAPERLGVILRWSCTSCAIVAVLLIFLPSWKDDSRSDRPRGFPYATMIRMMFDRTLFPLFTAISFLYAGYATIFFFLKGYGATKELPAIGFFFTTATLVMMVVRAVGGRWFDRWNKRSANACALGLCATASALIPAADTMPWMTAIAICCGIGWGVAMPLLNALVFDVSQPATSGMNQNIALLMLQAGFFLGPFAGGQLLSFHGYEAVLFGAAAMSAAAAFSVYRRNGKTHV